MKFGPSLPIAALPIPDSDSAAPLILHNVDDLYDASTEPEARFTCHEVDRYFPTNFAPMSINIRINQLFVHSLPILNCLHFLVIMGSVMRQKPEGDHNLKNFATHHGVTYEVVWRSIKKVIKALQKPFIAHVLLVLLLLSDHQLVLAASGGRMGGRSFSSSSSRRSRIRTRRAKSSSASNYCTQANSQESDVFLFVVSIIILIILETIKIIVFNKTTSVLKLQEDDAIDTFTEKLNNSVNKAASLGHTIEDLIIVRKLLNAVPDKFLQIVASIEQYSDLDEMSVDEAIGRLKTFEERIKSKKKIPVDSQESLMFTRHEGQRKPFRERGRFNQSRGREQDKNNYKREERASFEEDTRDKSQVTCYRCHKLGHYAYDCPNKCKNQVRE
ncbi:zinc finger, CCHC-type containing protein [Tanacetum coccineum]